MKVRVGAAILAAAITVSTLPVFAAGSISEIGVVLGETRAVEADATSAEAVSEWTETVQGVMNAKDATFAQIAAPLYADEATNEENEGLKAEDNNVALALVQNEDESVTLEEIKLTDYAEATPSFVEVKGDTSEDVTLTFSALRGVSTKDLNKFMIFIVNPKTGKKMFVRLDPSKFVSRNGQVTVKLPFEGLITLIQKKPAAI